MSAEESKSTEAAERKRSAEALRASEVRFQGLFENMQDGFTHCQMVFDAEDRPVDFIYLVVNSAFMHLTGLKNVVGKRATEVLPGIREAHPELLEAYGRVARTGQPERLELQFKPLSIWLTIAIYSPQPGHFAAVFANITPRKQAEANQVLLTQILGLLNRGGDLRLLIVETLRLIRQATACDAVGLRLRQGDDYPYYEQDGFSEEFLRQENFLCQRGPDGAIVRNVDGRAALGCTCGLVLSGRTDASLPCFTKAGSFWTNMSSQLLALSPTLDPRNNSRNRCFQTGYQSVALFPVRSGPEIIGILQLNDRRQGRFTPELIVFFEGVAQNIGLALQRTATEEALRQSELRLKRAQEIAHLGSWELDLTTNRLSWSDEVYHIFGLTPQQFDATYAAFLEHVHPEDRVAVNEAYFGSLRDNRDNYEIEHRVIRTDNGDVRTVHEKCEHFRDAAGKIVRSVGMVHDVTEHKRAEAALSQSEERFRALYEKAPLGIARIDSYTGRFLQINGKYCEIVGRPPQEMRALDFQTITHPDDLAADLQNMKRLREGQTRLFDMDKRYLRPDGSIVWVNLTVVPEWAEGEPPDHHIAMVADISARKQAESALWNAKAEAERANEAKDQFLAVLSHELRTPLTSMLGWVRMLQTHEFDQPTAKRGLEVIERNVKAQAHIVEDLLDVSRIIAGKMSIARGRVDLAAIVADALAEFVPIAEVKQLTLQYSPAASLFVEGDQARLRQVIWNLLSNAVKFTPAGGRIDIALKTENAEAVLNVSDTGKGINKEFLPYLFQRFRQEDSSTSRSYMGLGLGLAIVNSIVELHGGSISVCSEGEGKGASFSIRLPLLDRQGDPPAHSSNAGPARSGQRLSRIKVLVVDDDVDVCELLETVLRSEGAEVLQATSASEALIAWQQFQPALVVSDIGMPGEDGYALIQKLHALARQASRRPVPAVALTGYAQPEDVERCRQAGYQAHLAKPIDPNELIKIVAGILNAAT